MGRRSLNIILTALVAIVAIPCISSAFTNPLQKYNLYEDTHKEGSGRQGIMSEAFYNIPGADSNSTYNPATNSVPSTAKASNISSKTSDNNATNKNQRRNDYLRASSKKTFTKTTPAWLTAPSFYANPSLDSIKAKYKASNFAGCMQEATSYVKIHPNDTLGYYYLAMSYAKTGDSTNAVAAYEKVISLNDNPMIVKYATNGRNCVMNPSSETCYQNVNVPEYIYPYANIADGVDMTPVNTQDLINRNIGELQGKLSPASNNNATSQNSEDKTTGIKYPFANQDSELDKFINAPYGSGFSPELEKEYHQMKLRELQQNINNSNEEIKDIKTFDNIKSENELQQDTIKIAYDDSSADDIMKQFSQNPDFAQAQKDLDEIKMLFGSDNIKSENITDILPAMMKQDSNISPETLKTLMMQSVVSDIIDIDN